MTLLLEHAVNTARALPIQRQNEIAQIMLSFAGNQREVAQLSDEENAAITLSVEAANCGEFASDKEIKDMWAKHGL